MPYVKPLQLLRLQMTAAGAVKDYKTPEDVHVGKLKKDISLCPVCGESDCDERVFDINEYLFHESDVDGANLVDKPEL